MQLADYTRLELEDMASVLVGAINRIKGRGLMDMSYEHCAIGSVHQATWEFDSEEPNGERADRVLRVLDQLARDKGAPPHDPDHAGNYIEGYGQYVVDWDMGMVLRVFNEAVDAIQKELAGRTKRARQLVPA